MPFHIIANKGDDMRTSIEINKEKAPLKEVKKACDEVCHQARDTEFSCSQHNNGCSQDCTCSDYLRYCNITMWITSL